MKKKSPGQEHLAAPGPAAQDYRLSESVKDLFFRMSPDLFCVVSADGYFKLLNPAWESTLGFSVGELMRRPFEEFIHPDDVEATRREVAGLLTGKETLNFINRYRCRDGSYKWLQWRANAEEENTTIFAVARDITGERKIYDALKESEEKFHRLFDTIPDIYLQGDLNGRILEVSPSVEQVFHYRREELIGRHIGCLYADPAERSMNIKDLLEKKELRDRESRMLTKENEEIWVSVSANLRYNEQGSPGGIEGVIRDISGRKRAEISLKSVNDRFQSIFNLPLIGIAITSLEKGWLEINQEMLRILGYSEQELKKTSWAELTHPDDVEADVRQYDRILSGEIDTYTLEKRYIRHNGEYIWTIMSVGCVRKEDRSVDYFIALIRDITARKKAEAELEQKARNLSEISAEKDKFFSIISHDLRSPFSAFLNLTRLMEGEFLTLSRDQLLRSVTALRVSAENVYRLLENLLEWSRLQRGLTVLHPEPLLVQARTKHAAELNGDAFRKKNISLEIHVPGELEILADRAMVDCILQNLLSNAVKFTPEGGRVTVSAVRDDDSCVRITVEDTGIGMPGIIRDNLFKMGVETGRRGTNDEPSSGIGLLLAREFVEKNHGHMEVRSEEGKGSAFSFTLQSCPREVTDAHPENSGPAQQARMALENVKVLIVEDDVASYVYLTQVLKPWCREVLVSVSGTDAVDVVRQDPAIGLVLMDLQLPGINGYEAAREIRSMNREVVIIVQTAIYAPNGKELALQAGCNEFLLKPVDIQNLLRLISKYFIHEGSDRR